MNEETYRSRKGQMVRDYTAHGAILGFAPAYLLVREEPRRKRQSVVVFADCERCGAVVMGGQMYAHWASHHRVRALIRRLLVARLGRFPAER